MIHPIMYHDKKLSNCYLSEDYKRQILVSYGKPIAVYNKKAHLLRVVNAKKLTDTSKKHLKAFLFNFFMENTGEYILRVEE